MNTYQSVRPKQREDEAHLMSKHVSPLSLTFLVFSTVQVLVFHFITKACRVWFLDFFERGVTAFIAVKQIESSSGLHLKERQGRCLSRQCIDLLDGTERAAFGRRLG